MKAAKENHGRPKRGGAGTKRKKNQERDLAELLDFAASPHLKGMTSVWQQFYAAVKQSVKMDSPGD